jgi:RluA family pseudouridine synthase
MAKPNFIELPDCEPIPILYEDRSVIAIDKPRGWMLLPVSWQNTSRNLQAAINSSIAARDFWARSHGIKFLRYVHRLDADTSGILLFARSPGAVETYSDLFESRKMEKTYLAVVDGKPREVEWTCRLKLAPDPRRAGRMKVDSREGKEAETHFRVVQKKEKLTLVEARPFTGRMHQIRVHLAESGCPVVGDELYGREYVKMGQSSSSRRLPRRSEAKAGEEAHFKIGNRKSEIENKMEPRHLGCYETLKETPMNLGLRAAHLAYVDPFTKRRVEIHAPTENFLKEYGFAKVGDDVRSL